MTSSTSIDETFSPTSDDHVLLPVGDRQVAAVVDRAAVAGVEPAVPEASSVASRFSQYPASTVLPCASTSPESLIFSQVPRPGTPAPGQPLGPLLRLQLVVLRATG